MAKKLLFSAPADGVQPFTPQDFNEDGGSAARPFSGQDGNPADQLSTEKRLENLEQEARKKGFGQGHAEGYAEGLASGKDAVSSSIGRLEEIMVSLDGFRESKLAALLPEIIELAIDIAKKVIHKEMDMDRNLILSIAEDALSKVGSKDENIVIKVNPLDYEVMISQIDHLKERSGLKNITVEPSGAISPGGCYIDTPTGEVDATFEEQFKEVEDAITTATHRKM